MTPVETLMDALVTEARETAERIIQDAKKRVQDSLEEQRKKGRERAKEIVKSIEKKAQDDTSIVKLREITSAESKAKWVIQEKKNAMIDDVLNQVKDKFKVWTKNDDYIHFLENLIVEGGIAVGAPELEVMINKIDSNRPLNIKKIAEKIGNNTGTKTTIKMSARSIDTIGGALIQMPNEDLPKEFYEKNPSFKLISETNTITKFKDVLKTYIKKQELPDLGDSFKLKVLEDLLNNFIKIDSLENRSGNVRIDNTFEGILNNRDREFRFEIANILFK